MAFGGIRKMTLLMIDRAAFGRGRLKGTGFLGRLDDGMSSKDLRGRCAIGLWRRYWQRLWLTA